MIGGLKQTTSRLAIAAAAGLFTGGIALTPVQAASLGGDCCADLEERVAELEATTVRKGNRKVSVKLSGQVNRAIMWWDDGHDDDVYLVDNGVNRTRFRISGTATISPGRTAGYLIEQDLRISNHGATVSNCMTSTLSANNPEHCMKAANTNNSTNIRHNFLWVNFEEAGKVSLGQTNTASNGTSEVDLSGTGNGGLYSGQADFGGGFFFRSSTGVYTSKTVGAWTNLDGGSRQDVIRYDTPSIGGFTFSTSFWSDDNVDGAIRFKKEWNSVRCAAAAAVLHDTDEKNDDRWQYNGSASCIHTPSGLSLTVAYGDEDEELVGLETEIFYIKGGISRRWNSHGKTSIGISYGTNDNSSSLGDELQTWGIEFAQNIDAAAMDLYVTYMNWEYDDVTTTTIYEDIDFVIAGARIKF